MVLTFLCVQIIRLFRVSIWKYSCYFEFQTQTPQKWPVHNSLWNKFCKIMNELKWKRSSLSLLAEYAHVSKNAQANFRVLSSGLKSTFSNYPLHNRQFKHAQCLINRTANNQNAIVCRFCVHTVQFCNNGYYCQGLLTDKSEVPMKRTPES